MDAELKKAWVDALRSGEYEQGRQYLRFGPDPDRQKFCCLGVLCEVAIKRGLPVCSEDGGDFVLYAGSAELDEPCSCGEPDCNVRPFSSTELTIPLMELFGLDSTQTSKLMIRNDGTNGQWEDWTGNAQSFEQIADYIESPDSGI